jgi:hypothetical protein
MKPLCSHSTGWAMADHTEDEDGVGTRLTKPARNIVAGVLLSGVVEDRLGVVVLH